MRKMGKLHRVEINEKGVCLDGIKLKGVKSYALSQEENENIATLRLFMDVEILSQDSDSYFNTFQNECRDSADRTLD